MVAGRRQRVIKRFESHQEAFSEIDLLELLLFFAIPRCDTKKIAYRALHKYKNIHKLLENICPNEVEGIGRSTAAFLNLISKLLIALNRPQSAKLQSMYDFRRLIHHARMQLYWRKQEHLVIFFLDKKNRIISEETFAKGTNDCILVDSRSLSQRCIELGADMIILVHNHPSGNPSPSQGDIQCTDAIQKAINSIDVYLKDHIIVSENEYFSFREHGLLIN
jgi:DNA repair protein RadC